MFLILALLSAAEATEDSGASASADQGPLPPQEIQRPTGVHRSGEPRAPGAPSPCLAKAQVFVPWSLCKSIGAPTRAQAPHRLEGYVQASPELPSGTRCALVCTPEAKLASWSYLVPAPGYQGRLVCSLGPRLSQALTLGPPDTEPTDGVAIQWQTDLEVTTYILEDEELMLAGNRDLRAMVYEARRLLDPEIACPAGQPTGRSP